MTANTRFSRPRYARSATSLEVRDVQTVGAGRPTRFLEGRGRTVRYVGRFGWFLEQHAPESFKRSTTRQRGRKGCRCCCFTITARFPSGMPRNGHTLTALRGVWKLNDTPEAQRAAEAAEAGDLRGCRLGSRR